MPAPPSITRENHTLKPDSDRGFATTSGTPFPRPGLARTFEKVIWLHSPPWARWAAALVIAAGAMWIEFRPQPAISHPFTIEDIDPGTVVDGTNTEVRMVPVGTFSPVELGQTALAMIAAGDPVLASEIGESGQAIPDGWWSLEIPLPRGAQTGDAARIVLLDSDDEATGVVVETAGEDPLGSGSGLVAVEPERAAEVARAAGEGRVVVMIAPP